MYLINYFQYQEVVGCVCMLNYWFSSNDDICQTTTSFPGSSCRTSVAVRSGRCICTVTCSSWCTFTVHFLDSVTCPLLFRQGMGSRRAENCGVLRSCSSWRDGKAFLGRVHRYTARGDPRHQGGEGVAGTPGACSQVFCHPIRCMRGGISTKTCH